MLEQYSSAAFADGNPANGKLLSTTCIACHGSDGNSPSGIWPSIAGQHAAYLAKQLYDFRSGARENVQMAGLIADLSDSDIDDLAAFFSSQTASPGTAAPESLEIGQQLYRAGDSNSGTAACMACHGPNGAGNPVANYPRLSGQHAEYTISQLRNFKLETRNNDKNAVMRTISSKMTDAQIKAVAEYIRGLH